MLHDVVEDTPNTLGRLTAEGFTPSVVSAVDALTMKPGETRSDAARRAAGDDIACLVKLADNAENMELSRITSPSEPLYTSPATARLALRATWFENTCCHGGG